MFVDVGEVGGAGGEGGNGGGNGGGAGGGGTVVDCWVAGFLFFHEYNISGYERGRKSRRNFGTVTLPISAPRFSH